MRKFLNMTHKYSFLILFFAAAIKPIALNFTSLDLFGDEAQYLLWSQNLDLGYYSKPPLLAWILSGYTFFFGDGFVSIKLFPFFFYFFTSYVIYLLAIEIFKKNEIAVISAITFYLMPAVSVSSFLISTDVVLVFFWSLLLLFVLKIRKQKKIINFLILGILLGLALLTKYAAAYFVLSLIILFFFDNKTKEVFTKNIFSFFVFVFSALVVVMPNIIWNINNGWVTLVHTSENAGLSRMGFNILQGIEFVFVQGLMIGPLIFFVFLFNIKKLSLNFETKFLLCFSLPIFFIVFVESVLVRANANWAAVALVPLFLLIVNHVYIYSKKILVLSNFLNFVFCIVFFILIGLTKPFGIFDRINGLASFANFIDNKYLVKQKNLVVQDRLLFANIKYLFRKNDIVILTPYDAGGVIKSHFQLSDPLPAVFKESFIYIGNIEGIYYVANINNFKLVEKKAVSFKAKPLKIYEVNF